MNISDTMVPVLVVISLLHAALSTVTGEQQVKLEGKDESQPQQQNGNQSSAGELER